MSTNKRDYEDAMFSQGACNLGALLYSLPKIVDRIWEDARANGKGTDYVNTHPIIRLFAEQIAYLSSGREYSDAYGIVQDVIDGKRDPITLEVI